MIAALYEHVGSLASWRASLRTGDAVAVWDCCPMRRIYTTTARVTPTGRIHLPSTGRANWEHGVVDRPGAGMRFVAPPDWEPGADS